MAVRQDWLSGTLRDLRQAAGLSGMEAARGAGKSQRWVSDIERGKLVPREADLQALAEAYQVKPTMRRQLLQAARDLAPETRRARVIMTRGGWQMQVKVGKAERQAARIRSFQPVMVVGLAQTPAYMRSVFAAGGSIAGEDLDRSVAARVARQGVLGSGRDIAMIMTEGALRWQAMNPAVMTEQLDHLAEISQRPGVRVGIIPWTTGVDTFPRGGFHLYDSRAAEVATDVATAFIADSQDVSAYEKLWGELEALASWDAEAREHIERIAADYRGLRNSRN
ncbi:MAG: helix-turn-helix domain-containing protein [Streptosporangiaceae bacterium]